MCHPLIRVLPADGPSPSSSTVRTTVLDSMICMTPPPPRCVQLAAHVVFAGELAGAIVLAVVFSARDLVIF